MDSLDVLTRLNLLIANAKNNAPPEGYENQDVHEVTYTDDIGQDWNIQRIIKERPPKGWDKLFTNPAILAGAARIDKILEEQFYGNYVPLRKHIFRAYETPLSNVKVVIMGQDPYPTILPGGIPQATGMSFSLWKGAPIQPSLRNIYAEIKNEYPDFNPPNHGDLSGWAKQGVLLLNSCLTTVPNQCNAHGMLWRDVIKQTLLLIREYRPNTVVFLWGGPSQKLAKDCGALKILMSSHPSDRSCNSGDNPFMGNGHFAQCNEYLISKGITPIDWTHLP